MLLLTEVGTWKRRRWRRRSRRVEQAWWKEECTWRGALCSFMCLRE